jgi:hypothetical protein
VKLRRYLPVIAGVVFACAGGSVLVAWLSPAPSREAFADEQGLAPIPERAPRARRPAPAKPAPAAQTTGCAAAPTSGATATPPTGPQGTMLGACPGGTSP